MKILDDRDNVLVVKKEAVYEGQAGDKSLYGDGALGLLYLGIADFRAYAVGRAPAGYGDDAGQGIEGYTGNRAFPRPHKVKNRIPGHVFNTGLERVSCADDKAGQKKGQNKKGWENFFHRTGLKKENCRSQDDCLA